MLYFRCHWKFEKKYCCRHFFLANWRFRATWRLRWSYKNFRLQLENPNSEWCVYEMECYFIYSAVKYHQTSRAATVSRMDPFRFQARHRTKLPILGLMICLFCVIVALCLLMHVWFCCIRFSFNSIKQKHVISDIHH